MMDFHDVFVVEGFGAVDLLAGVDVFAPEAGEFHFLRELAMDFAGEVFDGAAGV